MKYLEAFLKYGNAAAALAILVMMAIAAYSLTGETRPARHYDAWESWSAFLFFVGTWLSGRKFARDFK